MNNNELIEQAKFFAFQVLDTRITSLNNDQLIQLKNSLFQYLKGIISSNNIQPTYLRNALAKTLGLLFCRIYVDVYPNFIKDFSSFTKNGSYNDLGTDYFLRFLLVVHTEIGDNIFQRERAAIDQNNLIKDAIRVNDMTNLTSAWKDILQHYSQQPASDLSNDIINNTIQNIGGYISWIEINLILDREYLGLIYQFLASGRPSQQRMVTCNALIEIMSKKMPPAKKLSLMNLLDLTSVISNLNLQQDVQDVDLLEALAQLVNHIASEYVMVLENATPNEQADNEFRSLATSKIIEIFPLVFQFFRHEYDDVSVHVFPFIGEFLLFLKKNIVENVDYSMLNNNEILTNLLKNVIVRMKYDEDDDGEDEEDVESHNEIRAKLKSFQDSVMVLNESLGLEIITNCINESLFVESKDWRTIELGLFELTNYSEILRNNVMNLPKTMINASQPYYVFNEMLCKVIENSPTILINHQSIQLLFFELILKHYNFFSNSNITVENVNKQDLILKVLRIFISEFGMFNNNNKVQLRSWYIFFRFIKLVKPKLETFILEELIKNISPLLEIKVSSYPPVNNKDPTEIDIENLEDSTSFYSQLYLFEAVGLLISFIDNSNIEFQVKLMEFVLQPLFSELENCINNAGQSKSTTLIPIRTHHILSDIGTFIRGFENCFNSGDNINEKFLNNIEQISQVVMITLENFIQFAVIRDAARLTLVRIFLLLSKNVSLTNNAIEVILNKYISLLLMNFETLKLSEISDFLAFIGQISHYLSKFPNFYQLLNNLMTPTLTKVFEIIDKKEIETDDFIKKEKESLKKLLITLLISLTNNNLTSLLISAENRSMFPTLVNNLLNYSMNLYEPSVSKLAIAELNNLILALGPGYLTDSEDINIENATYENINEILINNTVILVFEIPFKHSEFRIKDAEHRNIVIEFSRVLKSLSSIGSPKNSKEPNQMMVANLQSYMLNLNLSPNIVEDFLKLLITSNEKEFNKYLINFITQMRS